MICFRVIVEVCLSLLTTFPLPLFLPLPTFQTDFPFLNFLSRFLHPSPPSPTLPFPALSSPVPLLLSHVPSSPQFFHFPLPFCHLSHLSDCLSLSLTFPLLFFSTGKVREGQMMDGKWTMGRRRSEGKEGGVKSKRGGRGE